MTDKSGQEMYLQLVVLSMRAKKHLAVYCESKQLTPVQGIVLLLLEPSGKKTMHELSEMMGCDASNITGLVDRLEANGLICRCACSSDRRIKEISLSAKGEKCRSDILAEFDKAETSDLSKLEADEQAELKRLIQKILA